MTRFDHMALRCPRLGGEITFGYCRREQGDLPCRMILRCWEGLIPVEEHLREYLTIEEWERCFDAPPKDKITTLLEIADAVRKRENQ